MFIATAVVSVLLAIALAGSARSKFTRDAMARKITETVGWPADRLWILGTLEAAAGVGLLVGLLWWPLGAAAATGTVLYFAGALVAHARAGDREWQPALALGLLAVAALALRLLSA